MRLLDPNTVYSLFPNIDDFDMAFLDVDTVKPMDPVLDTSLPSNNATLMPQCTFLTPMKKLSLLFQLFAHRDHLATRHFVSVGGSLATASTWRR